MTNRRPALLAALALAACSPSAPDTSAAPATPPLAGARIGGPFTLVDQDGQQVSDRRFAGKYRIMYFGYTFCPDVCPTDMQTIGGAMKLLEASDPALAARIVPIFVTVDPTRDTPDQLKSYAANFHPGILYLTGAPDTLKQVENEYRIYVAKVPQSGSDDYLIDHSSVIYVMGTNGRYLAAIPAGLPPKVMAATLQRYL